MITIENTTIYKCEHCRKKYEIKRHCEAHELKCVKNPENFIRCIDCAHSEKRTMNYNKWIPCLIYGEKESDAQIEAYWCTQKKHWVYPHTKVNNPIFAHDIEREIPNEPMPKECDMYKYKFD